MKKHYKTMSLLILCLAGLAGCASLSARQALLDVSEDVYRRTGKKISWNTGTKADLDVDKRVKKLLSGRLTAKAAIQIALLRNRSLQATYTDLGVAQADLVQAGLLRNPILDAAVTFPEGADVPNLSFGLAFKFIDMFLIPLRKEAAKSELEQAKLRVSGAVIDHTTRTHLAYIDHVAAQQQVNLLKQVIRSISASVDTARALREAGNITTLQYDQQKNALTQSKLELANAELTSGQTRERLNVLMGLTGSETHWRAPDRLPGIPSIKSSLKNIEGQAVKNSLNLAEIKQELQTIAIRYRITNVLSVLPDLEAGGEYERDDGEVERGPIVEIEIPIFDTGKAKRAKVILEVRKLRDQYWDMGVRIRSAARLYKAKLLTQRKNLSYYRSTVLPESERMVTGMQRDYNAMQSSVFQLINARKQQIVTGQKYIAAQQSYWKTFISFQQLTSGRLPDNAGMESSGKIESAQAGSGESGGH